MYPISTPEVIVVRRALADPRCARRFDRMMRCIAADRVVEVDDTELAALFAERGWERLALRTGQHRMTRHPAIIFNAFRWDADDEIARLRDVYPALRPHFLLGDGQWNFRDARHFAREYGYVCQSAWEIHCAYGCLHACDYCHIPPYFTIMLDLETLAERVRAFGETIPEQRLYKFDNATDTITLEPEYGASDVMVRMFAAWPGRWLLLYTKSDNVDHLRGLDHRGHTLVSWSMSSDTVAARIEKETPSPDARIAAMETVERAGYPTRVRISPICPVRGWREEYADMIDRLLGRAHPEVISVDVVGWMHAEQMLDGMDVALFDPDYRAEVERQAREGVRVRGKHLFPHAMREEILRFVVGEILRRKSDQRVSLCNETAEMWRAIGPLTGMTPGDYVCCCGPASTPDNPLLAAR